MQLIVNVKGVESLKRKLAELPAKLQGKAMQMAMNKTVAKGRTEVSRAVREEFAISAADVRNSMSIVQANRKQGNDLQARIDIFGSARKKGRSLNTIHFLERAISMAAARKRLKKGTLFAKGRGGRLLPVLGFKFKKGGGVKNIEGAFIGNKGRTIFVRTGDQRLPIKPVQMIGVSQMFNTKRISTRVMDKVRAELGVEMERAINEVLRRA